MLLSLTPQAVKLSVWIRSQLQHNVLQLFLRWIWLKFLQVMSQ